MCVIVLRDMHSCDRSERHTLMCDCLERHALMCDRSERHAQEKTQASCDGNIFQQVSRCKEFVRTVSREACTGKDVLEVRW